jgi:hypothetical protein
MGEGSWRAIAGRRPGGGCGWMGRRAAGLRERQRYRDRHQDGDGHPLALAHCLLGLSLHLSFVRVQCLPSLHAGLFCQAVSFVESVDKSPNTFLTHPESKQIRGIATTLGPQRAASASLMNSLIHIPSARDAMTAQRRLCSPRGSKHVSTVDKQGIRRRRR